MVSTGVGVTIGNVIVPVGVGVDTGNALGQPHTSRTLTGIYNAKFKPIKLTKKTITLRFMPFSRAMVNRRPFIRKGVHHKTETMALKVPRVSH